MSKPRLRRLRREHEQDVWRLSNERASVEFTVHWMDVFRIGGEKALAYWLCRALRDLERA